LPAHEKDFLSVIKGNVNFVRRGDVEHNPGLQQPIVYVWFVNPQTKKFFSFIRKGEEERLHNKLSCALGGHVDEADGREDPIGNAIKRELTEEIRIKEYPTPRIVGYINQDSTPTESVHFGIVAIAETTLSVEGIGREGRWISGSELDRMIADPEVDVEPWTRISWPYMKSYIESLK
jgi:predicted NUDIX family phosphoesterase